MKATPPHRIRFELGMSTPSFARNDATYKKAALVMPLFTQVPRETVRKGPVVALRATETVLLGPFWPPDTAKIHVRSVARTPFRTVSLGTWVNKAITKGRGVAGPGPHLFLGQY